MKFTLKLIAAMSSAIVLTGSILPTVSEAAQASMPLISVENITASQEDAAVKIREYLKARSSVFSVEVDKEGYTQDNIAPLMMYKAFEETGKGDEGDYLRFSVKNYKCTISANKAAPSVYQLTFTVEYYTTPEEEAMLDDKIDIILSSLSLNNKTDYEKIRAIYKYAAEKITYSENIDDPYVYSAYNAVINGNAVCQGIAQLLYKMYNRSGIPCRIIAGISHDLSGRYDDGNHVWLIVKLEDKYYYLDPTWDLRYKGNYFIYFLKGSDDFDAINSSIVHIPRNDNGLSFPDYNSAEFHNAYPLSQYEYTPPSYSLGDINGDKHVDSIDASMILAEYARISGNGSRTFNSVQTGYADVNGDGIIDSVDASAVLSYYTAVLNGKDIKLSDLINSH